MINRDRRNPEKVYLKVRADFYPDGRVMPLVFKDEEEANVRIDRVMAVCEAPALKKGGQGTRYTCRIGNSEVYLFRDRDKWFMEEK